MEGLKNKTSFLLGKSLTQANVLFIRALPVNDIIYFLQTGPYRLFSQDLQLWDIYAVLLFPLHWFLFCVKIGLINGFHIDPANFRPI